MIDRFRVSRATVREAVSSLVHEGRLTRIQGKGTFVAARQTDRLSIAVVMPYLYFTDQPEYVSGTDVIPRLVQAIEGECRKTQSNIILLLANQDIALERENLTRVLESDIDAIVLNYIGGRENRDCLEAILSRNIPLILIDRYLADLASDYVVTDNAGGSEAAVTQLEAAGFEQIWYVGAEPINSALKDREYGYVCAIERRGRVPFCLSLGEAIERFAGGGQERIALLCCDATRCAGLWNAVQHKTERYHRLALACFDEPYLTFPTGVTVVKVLQPLQEIGQCCIQLAKERVMMLRTEYHKERRQPKQLKLSPSVYVNSQKTDWRFQKVCSLDARC